MKILYLCHCVPYPPDKGEKLRAFHQLRALGETHEVHLLAIAKEAEDLSHARGLDSICSEIEIFQLRPNVARTRAMGRLLAGSGSLTHAYFGIKELARRTREIAQSNRVDAILAYTAAMAPYAELAPASIPRFLDLVDVDSAKWATYEKTRRFPASAVFGVEARRLRRYEASLDRSFSAVLVSTEREAEVLRSFASSCRPIVLRNGVDTEYFRPSAVPKSETPQTVFTGQMDYFPNEDAVDWFATRVVPRLRHRHPDLSFVVVGRRPSKRVSSLARIPGVTVTGEVDDVRPYLERSWVFVAPLRVARGVQNKVLEAMAMGLPVVCSPPVIDGLRDGGIREGIDLRVADGAARFEEELDALLSSDRARVELGVRARQVVSDNLSWSENMRVLSSLVSRYEGESWGVEQRASGPARH